MKKIILFLFFVIVCVINLYAQNNKQYIYLYTSEYNSGATAVFTYSDGVFYSGKSTDIENFCCVYSDNKLIINPKLIFTYSNGKIYLGNVIDNYVLKTYSNDKIYLGDSKDSSDILFTYIKGKVYKGNSADPSNLLLTTTGYVPIPIIFGFLLWY